MADRKLLESSAQLWALAASQHGVVSRSQLLELGLSPAAITHRLQKGRLHPTWRGVYAVGRPQLNRHGRWMAALLSCGPTAVLSHGCAAAIWGIRQHHGDNIHISLPAQVARRRPGITIHRRARLRAEDVVLVEGLRVTSLACTLIDVAPSLSRDELEIAINEADRLDLTPGELLADLERRPWQRGAATVRKTLTRRTFALTDSELERRFLPLASRAGLDRPKTRQYVNGYRVDFYWPDLGLVVETDGLRYHRTPAQQAKDRRRDQTHLAAGLTPLRFTHGEVRYEPGHVEETLSTVGRRLRARRRGFLND